jgi:hypothetical protein
MVIVIMHRFSDIVKLFKRHNTSFITFSWVARDDCGFE